MVDEVVAMTPERGKAGRRPLESALSDERRSLIHRYMEDGEPETEKQPEKASVDEVEAAGLYLVEEPHVTPQQAVRPVSVLPGGGGRTRRGRPPGRKARRQVHFHVDAEQDRMLLSAAGRFGSQQKALVAALHALNEVFTLREQVELLHAECERQRRLLSEAEALFRPT